MDATPGTTLRIMADDDATVTKLVLLGNGSIGKTSLCNRFKDDGFQRVYKQTIGGDFYEKRLTVRGKILTLQASAPARAAA